MITEALKFELCREAQTSSLEDPGDPVVQMKFKGSRLESSLLLGKTGLCILFKSSGDRRRPTHILENDLLYSEFPCLDVNHPKTPSLWTHRINRHPSSWIVVFAFHIMGVI